MIISWKQSQTAPSELKTTAQVNQSSSHKSYPGLHDLTLGFYNEFNFEEQSHFIKSEMDLKAGFLCFFF